MKAKKIFVTVDFNWIPGTIDYPQNIPLPRIGETIIMSGTHKGVVYDVRHVITGNVADIKICVKRN